MKPLLLCLLLLPLSLFGQDASQTQVVAIQWEYTVAYGHDFKEAAKLTKLGAEGWELVSVVYVEKLPSTPDANGKWTNVAPHFRYYLKRQLAQQSPKNAGETVPKENRPAQKEARTTP